MKSDQYFDILVHISENKQALIHKQQHFARGFRKEDLFHAWRGVHSRENDL